MKTKTRMRLKFTVSFQASSTSAAAAAAAATEEVSPPPPKASSPNALMMLSTTSSPTPPSAAQRPYTPNNELSDNATGTAANDQITKSNQDNGSAIGTSNAANSLKDPFSGIMHDADKLKLMLLAWNYQNSNSGEGIFYKSRFSFAVINQNSQILQFAMETMPQI